MPQIIEISKEDIKQAGKYTDNENCPLAMKTKLMFPHSAVVAFSSQVAVGTTIYRLGEPFNSEAYERVKDTGIPFITTLKKGLY